MVTTRAHCGLRSALFFNRALGLRFLITAMAVGDLPTARYAQRRQFSLWPRNFFALTMLSYFGGVVPANGSFRA
jgi:hypothetical protein